MAMVYTKRIIIFSFYSDAIVNGSHAVAILKRQKSKYIILIKQYRIPMKAYTLEFPAGLMDEGESPEQCALRELKVTYTLCITGVP